MKSIRPTCVSLLVLIIYLAGANGFSSSNPIEIMSNVMRRMRAEMEHFAQHDRARQLSKFKNHVQHIVRVHLVFTRGGTPPDKVMARLNDFMRSQEKEMERQMHALMASVSSTMGHRKVHLLVKKVREHCNKHITEERRKSLKKLTVTPKKKFIALDGFWTEHEAKLECHRHGGHLAVIASAADRMAAAKAIPKKLKNGVPYFVNAVRAHSRHAIWMPIRSPWYRPRQLMHCASIGRLKGGLLTPANCDKKQGALCEFLTFSPWVRLVGRKAYFGIDGTFTFEAAKQRCAQRGGQLATIFNMNDAKMAWLNRTRTAAFIGAWRKLGVNETNSQWFMGPSAPLKWSNARYSKDAGIGYDCYAMAKDGYWDQVSCNKRLAVMCEAPAVYDDRARALDGHSHSKIFVAFNNKTDLFTREDAEWKCSVVGGRRAKIRSNTQQLAALAAMKYNHSVLLDRITRDKDGELRWSDNTRLSQTQLWRLQGQRIKALSTVCVSLNKFGEWILLENCNQKLGLLCEIVYRGTPTSAYQKYFDFETDIRMTVDYNLVTQSAGTEALFRRAMEAEVMKSIKILHPTVQSAVVVSLKRGSTVATVRVWTPTDGRGEANALQGAVGSGEFYITFMGKRYSADKDQDLRIHLQNRPIICRLGPHHKSNRVYKIVIPTVLALLIVISAIILAVCPKKRKKQRTQVDSVFTVKHEKELYAEEEKKGVLAKFDPPPPYISPSEDAPPDYAECVNLETKQMKV